jgi:tyrosine-protein kinase Etk/Wzc
MQSSSQRSGTTENKDLSQIISRYLPFWPFILGLVVVCLIGAWVYVRYTIPVYESTAKLLIKDDENKPQDKVSMDLFSSKKIVENEVEVLHSRTVVKEVVKNLGLYAPVFIQGKVNVTSAYTSSPIRVEVKEPDSLKPVEKVPFSYDAGTHQVIVGKQAYPLNAWVTGDFGQVKFTPNPNFQATNEKRPMFFSLVDVRAVTGGIIGALQVAPVSKVSTIITLTIRDQVPQRGEDVLNNLIKVYNAASVADKNALAANALSFLEGRLRIFRDELDSTESVVERFKVEKGIVDISEQSKLYLSSVGSNDQKVSEIDVQLAVLNQIEEYTTSNANSGSNMLPSTIGLSDPNLSSLLTKLYDLEIQYEKLRKSVGEDNITMVSLRNQIQRLKPSILDNIRNQRSNLQASRNNLSQTSDQYAGMIRGVPQKERELLKITRDQQITNNVFNFLLQKKEEAALSYASAVSDSRLLDGAESGAHPVSPKKMLIYAIAVILGLGIGIGVIFMKEMFNQTIRSRSEIEELSSFPIIGEISHDATKRPIVIASGDRSYIAEQFRQIRTSLSYLGVTAGKKRLLVTSAIPGEGKSFVAANLAISLALTEKKIVIVELDLRKPKLTEMFNEKETGVGISEYLMRKAEAPQIVKRTEINPNLYLITAGAIPQNPSELILSDRFEQLLKYLDKEFDFIIIETAPVSAVTDAYIVSKFCDATLYIIRQGLTRRGDIKLLEDNLKIRGLHNAAVIFNGVKLRNGGKYGYGYGYGYGFKENGMVNKFKKSELSNN